MHPIMKRFLQATSLNKRINLTNKNKLGKHLTDNKSKVKIIPSWVKKLIEQFNKE